MKQITFLAGAMMLAAPIDGRAQSSAAAGSKGFEERLYKTVGDVDLYVRIFKPANIDKKLLFMT